MPITEHATDTHGASLLNFALFDLVGLQLSPRIRDLGKITLHRTGARAETAASYPTAGPLLARRCNTELIAQHWDEMLRVAASLKYGHVTASLIVGKLSRADRQNTLAAALKEYGALRRTVYGSRYLSREDYRRKNWIPPWERSTEGLAGASAPDEDVITFAEDGCIVERHRPVRPGDAVGRRCSSRT